MEKDIIPTAGRPIIWEQAPCQPNGVLDYDEEENEGTFRCPANPEGCYASGAAAIIQPRRLKPEFASLPTS